MGNFRVLVLAPIGKDSELLVKALAGAGLHASGADTAAALASAVRSGTAGALLIAAEALAPSSIQVLHDALDQQPGWSDMPVLILTSGGKETLRSNQLERELLPLPNITLLERPIRLATLVSSVKAALRSRERQYEVRNTIAERDRALTSLQQSEQQSRLILQSTRDCIKLLDLDANLLQMNQEGQDRLGITDFDRVRNNCWIEFWESSDRERAKEAVDAARAGGEGRFEGHFRTLDGESTWWDVSITPVRDGKGETIHLLAVSREITARKRAEQALIQSEKLAAVGRLAASISHEINNPLEAVTNLLYLTAQEKDLPLQTRAYLALADQELARVSQITAQTLRFHRQSTHPRAIGPEELLDPVLALYQGRLVNSDIVLHQEHRQAGHVTCYEGEIRQVLNNLVGNAIDAMRSGGRLRVRSHPATEWKTGSKGIRISIADTGHGMPPEVSGRIFEAFYTTKGANGTGLGLWISRTIVEKHQGKLQVRSRPHTPDSSIPASGTVFSFFLPTELCA